MRRLFQILGAGALLLFSSGCAAPRVDWSARVGHYTYDEAVLELGPPDKSAKLTDGTVVGEWLTFRGRASGTYNYYGGTRPWMVAENASPDYFIRLNFAPDGKLVAWKRVMK